MLWTLSRSVLPDVHRYRNRQSHRRRDGAVMTNHEPEVLLGAVIWEATDGVGSTAIIGGFEVRVGQELGHAWFSVVVGKDKDPYAITIHHAFATLEDAKAAATVIARLHARCYEKAAPTPKHVWNRNTLEFEREITDAYLRVAIKKKLRENADHMAIAALIAELGPSGVVYPDPARAPRRVPIAPGRPTKHP
jgi:hypothetical protein